MRISTIWILIAVGVIFAAVSNVFLADILGFGIVSIRLLQIDELIADVQLTPLGALSQVVAYVLMCWGGPFPLFVIAYFFLGLGAGWMVCHLSLTSICILCVDYPSLII